MFPAPRVPAPAWRAVQGGRSFCVGDRHTDIATVWGREPAPVAGFRAPEQATLVATLRKLRSTAPSRCLGDSRIAVARAAPAIRLHHKRWVFRSFSSRHFAPAAQRSTRQGRGAGPMPSSAEARQGLPVRKRFTSWTLRRRVNASVTHDRLDGSVASLIADARKRPLFGAGCWLGCRRRGGGVVGRDPPRYQASSEPRGSA